MTIDILTEPEKSAVLAARQAFADRGIEFHVPWEGTLDDLERERFEALIVACRSYKSRLEV